MARGFAIAAGHRLTAETGAEVLRAGGTAADAVVAAAFAAMVAEPVLAGLFGGGFAMLREPVGRTRLLDAFTDTPLSKRSESEVDIREIEADFGTTRQSFRIGTGTIAASCLPAGLADLHARYGRLGLRELVAPATQAAREGVALTAYQARLAEIIAPILTASPAARALHCEGDPLRREGATARNSDLADVLEELGREGPRFASEGELAARLADLAADGGHLTAADCVACQPVWREPRYETRQAATLALTPAPALGGLLLAAALREMPRQAGPVARARAVAAAAALRDAAHRSGDPATFAEGLAVTEPGRPLARRGTTHISVTDADGLGVALTLSNGEGCGLVIPGTGVMPNNMLGEDDLVPGDPLGWRPATRLSSMMAPMAVSWPDGRVALLGSGGSSRIPGALAQVTLALVDRAAPLEAAIAAPRLHAETDAADALDAETEGLAEGDRAALAAAYPEARFWHEPSMFFGGVHGVLAGPRGPVSAAGDRRRDGHAICT